MPEPLQGIRVVEMATGLQGPAAAAYLADMGAEVIKIEPPEGDPSRFHRGVNNYLPEGTPGAQFVVADRGKRSVSLNLHSEVSREAVYRLLEQTDVFLTNYLEDSLDRMGLGYDEVHPRNPRLIYATANGFGPAGPEKLKGMVDGAGQARGGLINITGDADGPPVLPGAAIADTAGAMQLALGVMTALMARANHGVGQKVSVSSYGAQIWLQMWEITQSGMTGQALTRQGPHHPNIPGMYGVYETADGGSLFLAFARGEEAWQAFCAFAGVPELGFDERWNSLQKRMGMGHDAEGKVAGQIRPHLERIFKSRPMDEWVAFLDSQPEIIYNRVYTYDDVLNDPQAAANGYIVEKEVPLAGPRKVPGTTVALSETPGSPKDLIPELGQHTEEVLMELGYDWDEITAINENTRDVLRQKFIALGQEPPF